jgi:hypothetical protein
MSPEIAKSENGQNRPTEVAVFSRKTRKSRIFAFCKVGLKGRNLTENQNYGKLFLGKIHNFGHTRPEVSTRKLQSVRMP